MAKPLTTDELIKFIWEELQEAIFNFNRYKRGDKNDEETQKESLLRLEWYIFALEQVLEKMGVTINKEHANDGTISKYQIFKPTLLYEYDY